MEHDGCKGCLYETEPPESVHCTGCLQNAVDKYTPMTNADRIRNMTDEELHNLLTQARYCLPADRRIGDYDCTECRKRWLKEKVE